MFTYLLYTSYYYTMLIMSCKLVKPSKAVKAKLLTAFNSCDAGEDPRVQRRNKSIKMIMTRMTRMIMLNMDLCMLAK